MQILMNAVQIPVKTMVLVLMKLTLILVIVLTDILATIVKQVSDNLLQIISAFTSKLGAFFFA